MRASRGRLTRRELIKRFGALAFVLTPVARAMGYIAGGTFVDAPRFVMFFKGGAFHPGSTNPSSIMNLAGTPIAPLQPHASDIILFKGMQIHGGSPQSDGYQEEHGAGLIGCVTGHEYKYSENDSYYAYTDHASIDVVIADSYKSRPMLSSLPLASLHIGAGAHSDADNVGLGQRYISYRERQSGDSQYGNAIEPIQDAGQVYDQLMQRIQLLCGADSNQPMSDQSALRAALTRKKSLVDFRLQDIADAKRTLGMDTEHARKLDGLVEQWHSIESGLNAELGALDGGGGGTAACPDGARPTGNGNNEQNCDDLSPVHDQMIDLIKLAFEWDVTRVVAYTLSGASSGQRMPSRGVDRAHHSMEHGNDVDGLNVMGTFYSEKFARLLGNLAAIDDGNGETGLQNSAVILGMECWSDSANGHYLEDIPFILAGQGAGKFETGRIVNANGRSNNDLLISVQNACGIPSSTFGLPDLCEGPIV
jgi:hypothetical protein